MKFLIAIIIICSTFSCDKTLLHHTSEKFQKPYNEYKKVLILNPTYFNLDSNFVKVFKDDFKTNTITLIEDSLKFFTEKYITNISDDLLKETNNLYFKNNIDFEFSDFDKYEDSLKINKKEYKKHLLLLPKNGAEYFEKYDNKFNVIIYLGYFNYNFFESTSSSVNGTTGASYGSTSYNKLIELHYFIYDVNEKTIIQKGWSSLDVPYHSLNRKDLQKYLKYTFDKILQNSPLNKNFIFFKSMNDSKKIEGLNK